MKMRNLITAALLINGAILASQSAFGQSSQTNYYQWFPNNLVMGFQNKAGGGTQDYIINLGPAANIVGGTTVVDLSSDFSLSDFNAVLGGSSSMFGGVIGAASASVNGGTGDVYLTQLRSGVGTPSVPGSSVSQQLSRNQDNTTYTQVGTLVTPNAGSGVLDTTKTWESLVDPIPLSGTPPAFQNDTGLNPDSPVGSSSPLYEDLWETSSSTLSGTQPFAYLGYFTLDLTGASPKLTFTPKDAPATLTKPTIALIKRIGNTVTVVSSNAVPNYHYQLQYTTSLHPASWVSVGSLVLANGTTVTNVDSTATAAQRFYQIQAQ